MVYGEVELQVESYNDASFQSEKDDSKFESDYVFYSKLLNDLLELVPNLKRLWILGPNTNTTLCLMQQKMLFGFKKFKCWT